MVEPKPPDPLHQFLLAFSDLVNWLASYRKRTRKVKGYFHYGPARPMNGSDEDDATPPPLGS
jgi:hypothetical protein